MTVKLEATLVFELYKSGFKEGYKLVTSFGSGQWRWGHVSTYVIQNESGETFYADLCFHVEEGYQDEDVIKFFPCKAVEKVTVEWVDA